MPARICSPVCGSRLIRKVWSSSASRLIALNFGALLGGAIATETVFSLDGMGLYFITALGGNDPYPIMAWLMITATMIIIFNLLADIAYGYLDPRVRYD